MIDVALAGCGHMGRHHARTIAANPGSRLAVVIDAIPERAAAIAERTGARVATAIPVEVDAVVVATPTRTHAEVAGPLLARGQWCLVEKPVTASAEQAALLQSDRLVVGHSERFNPAVRALGPIRPRLVVARRLVAPSGRGGDVDVVLDLMIHDLDLILSWCDPEVEVEVVDAVGVAVHGAGWDVASVRLRAGEMVASLTASRVIDRPERVVEISAVGRAVTLDMLAGTARTESGPLEPVDDRDALSAQWDAFTRAVRGEAGPAPRGRAGLRAVQLAERVRAAIQEKA